MQGAGRLYHQLLQAEGRVHHQLQQAVGHLRHQLQLDAERLHQLQQAAGHLCHQLQQLGGRGRDGDHGEGGEKGEKDHRSIKSSLAAELDHSLLHVLRTLPRIVFIRIWTIYLQLLLYRVSD